MTGAETEAVIETYVRTELLHGQAQGLDADSPLLEWGIIESMTMVSLIAFLEERFGLRVPDQELIAPDNFVNIRAIAAMVQRLSGGRIATGS